MTGGQGTGFLFHCTLDSPPILFGFASLRRDADSASGVFSSLHLYYIPNFRYCQHILLTFLIFYIKFIFYRAFFASSADMPQAERKNPFEAKNFSFAAADAPQARLTAGAQDIKRRAAAVIGRFCTPLKICVNCFRQAVFLLTISGNAGKINT